MRTTIRLTLLAAVAAGAVAATAQTPPSRVVTQATMDEWKKSQSNWGRWGREDQLGTLNLITPTERKAAAALVREGLSVSMARNLVPQPAPAAGTASTGPGPAVQQRMLSGPPIRPSGSTDSLTIAAHGYTITHFDAMGHHLLDGKMYNGFPASDYLSMETGLTRGSVLSAAQGVLTRGVLVDIPRLRGVRYLEPGTPIYVEDLEAWEKWSGVKLKAGDAVFIRTGRWEREKALGPWEIARNSAGLDASVIPWLRKRNIALLGSESALSVVPFPATTTITNPDDYLPVHNFALVALGMNLIDNMDLGPVSDTAARLRRHTFQFSVAPIRVTTGTGVPVNPIATF